MRCFVKIFDQTDSIVFKGTLSLNPGNTSMSQIEVNGAMATIEVQARREGDAPDILDELEKEATAVGASSLVDTIKRMRREFNEIPLQGAKSLPEKCECGVRDCTFSHDEDY